tara:strand:- start:28703 stop:31600 length:2898 start_codon:yes stop_codon:yes gene_type:complete
MIKEHLKLLLPILLMGVVTLSGQRTLDRSAEEIGPLDPSIRYGRLENGFTYYIKGVEDGQKKIKMRLIVRAGNYYESQEQLDFAHAIEHLAFKCAEHFPVNLLNDNEMYSNLGITSNDIDARTSFLHTRYFFDVPYDRTDALDTGLLWFQDIANLEMSAKKINDEKGPLRQEVTFRAGSRIQEIFNTKLMESKLFACERDFSDFFEHNKTFEPGKLMEFYKEWYRPDRMAVVLVGETTDMENLEKKVRERFSDLQNPSPTRSWADCRAEYLKGPKKFAVVERPQVAGKNAQGPIEFHLYMRDSKYHDRPYSWKALQKGTIWEVLDKMVNNRLKEVGKAYTSAFFAKGSDPNHAVPAYRMKITDRAGNGEQALAKAIGILQGVKKYGFGKNEWEKAKEEALQEIQQRDTSDTDYWLEQIQDHYLYEEYLPKNKREILRKWCLELSIDEFNSLAGRYIADHPDDIGIIAPKGWSYSEAEVRAWIDRALAQKVQPYVAPEVPLQLLGSEKISSLKEVGYQAKEGPAAGIMEIVLENGVKVVLDSSGLKKNSVHLLGFSPNGASCFPKADYFSALNAPSIIKNAGVGKMDKFELASFLSRTGFPQGIHPYIEHKESGIQGTSDKEDVEGLFQLVYLYFTEPRRDKLAFEDWKMEEKDRYTNPSYSVSQEDLGAASREVLGDSSITPQGTKRFHGISKTDMDRAYSIHERIYGNAGSFTFLISGDFSTYKILPLVRKYLGNLPSKKNADARSVPRKQESLAYERNRTYTEFNLEEVSAHYKMKSILYSRRYIAKVEDPFDWKEHIKIDVLGILMDSKISELRYSEDAALFHPSATAKFHTDPLYYDVAMLLDCLPDELEKLRSLCREIVLDVKENNDNRERFNDVMSTLIISKYSANKESNFKKVRKLKNYYAYGGPWIDPLQIEEYVQSLTYEDIQKTAQKYLKDEHLTEFVLRNDRSAGADKRNSQSE